MSEFLILNIQVDKKTAAEARNATKASAKKAERMFLSLPDEELTCLRKEAIKQKRVERG